MKGTNFRAMVTSSVLCRRHRNSSAGRRDCQTGWGRRRRTWCWTSGRGSEAAAPSCPRHHMWKIPRSPDGDHGVHKIIGHLQWPGRTMWASLWQRCIPKIQADSPSSQMKQPFRTSHWEPEKIPRFTFSQGDHLDSHLLLEVVEADQNGLIKTNQLLDSFPFFLSERDSRTKRQARLVV